MIRAICSITEIKELLNIVMQVEEKIQNQSLSNHKKVRIINSIMGTRRGKTSHRETLDFLDT